jgi:molybdopterin converting factor subunit 1
MRIHVKLFAVLRDRAGRSQLEIELPAGATVADGRARILADVPALGPSLGRVAFAVNRSYAGVETVLREGDELALLPPVSGG